MSLAPGKPWTFRTVDTAAAEGGIHLLLDGRPLRLPDGGATLALRTAALADAVAAEWREAGARKDVRPETLPLTRFAMTAAGRVAPDREAVVADLLRFLGADLLRHRASAPEALVRAEEQAWQPWLDWAAARFGVAFPPVTGVMPAEPPAGAEMALGTALRALPDAHLAVLLGIVPLLGSLILGFAVATRAATAPQAVAAALADQLFEAMRWGEEEVTLREQEHLERALLASLRFLDLSDLTA